MRLRNATDERAEREFNWQHFAQKRLFPHLFRSFGFERCRAAARRGSERKPNTKWATIYHMREFDSRKSELICIDKYFCSAIFVASVGGVAAQRYYDKRKSQREGNCFAHYILIRCGLGPLCATMSPLLTRKNGLRRPPRHVLANALESVRFC